MSDIGHCFCCGKEVDRAKCLKISSTTSGKCKDKTNAEDRFICKKCNHLKETTNERT